jgi:hypothetical protein
MAQNVAMEAVGRTLKQAKNFIVAHKQSVGEVVKGLEAFAAPLAVGLAEGRLANDGSGHVHVGGVPLTLGLGGIAMIGAASGYLEEYGVHCGNMAAGLLGSYGADLGRQIGLGMRAKAGKPIAAGMLSTARLAELNKWANDKGKTLGALSAPGEFRIGLTDQNLPSQYATYGAGAAPAPLTSAQLEQMVAEASAATP